MLNECHSAVDDHTENEPDISTEANALAWRAAVLVRETSDRLIQLRELVGTIMEMTEPRPGQPALTTLSPHQVAQIVPAPRHDPRPTAEEAMLARLTAREGQVLELLVLGHSNRRIARLLRISETTVKNHLHAIFLKLEVSCRAQVIALVLSGRRPAS